ncbi:MAG: hypothetical protein H0T89_00075 [Deltaproteobacteria bacterium]|nr:hypothetical protein [Deltaproteobacteria bacterium]MDQ3295309.1 hypothetical protein [Myxococcota bacterium]
MKASARNVKKTRDAKASRSSFRAKPKATAKPKAKAKAEARPKVAKAKAKPPRSTPAKRRARTPRETVPEARSFVTRPSLPIVLGDITVPSGKLAIFDIGLCGYLPREALEPTIITCEVPRDRPLPVVGAAVGRGRYAACWDHVAVLLAPAGEIASSRKLGEAAVDFARLVCMDHAALDAWQHEDSLDGLADVVFWGRDDAILGRVMRAPRIQEGYGWSSLPLVEAEAKADEIARKKAENRWLLASDLRPHSHHYYALAAARQNPRGAGTLELAGTRLMLLFTTWGDGVFPVYLDSDHDDRPLQIRIQLATAESNAAMAAVNP